MNDLEHYATCSVWSTGSWTACNCKTRPPWRVRKEQSELFAWRIWRYTGDGSYEHVMRCSSWKNAMSLVDGFVELRRTVSEEQL